MADELNVEKPKGVSLIKLAPNNVDPAAYIKVLKDQLLASKNTEPTDAELLYFAQVCHASGLDPARKEIYGIYRKDTKTGKQKLTIQTGIDGFRSVAERTGKYAGSKEYVFTYDDDKRITVGGKVVPNAATATVIKLIGGHLVETTRTVKWEDFYPGDYMGKMWVKFPEIMLGKVAEAQALRAAFPNTGQLYLAEEIDNERATVPSETKDDPQLLDEVVDTIKSATDKETITEAFNRLNSEQKKQVTHLVTERYVELATGGTNAPDQN